MGQVSTVIGENIKLFAQDEKGNRIFCSDKKRELNGNNLDTLVGNNTSPSNNQNNDPQSEDEQERCLPDCEITTNSNV